jgi:hypothetical protein
VAQREPNSGIRDQAVEQVEIGAADRRRGHAHDAVLRVLDLRLGLAPNLQPVRTVIGERSHGSTMCTAVPMARRWSHAPLARLGVARAVLPCGPARSRDHALVKTKPMRKTSVKAKSAKKPARKPAAPKPARAKMPARRADYGAPVEGFFAKQPVHLRPILQELRKLVESAEPKATASLKWGMPFYEVGGAMMCALGAHKSHVNLILPGPPGTYSDPDGRLQGGGKTGKHLQLRSMDELPKETVRAWLATAARLAREKGDRG